MAEIIHVPGDQATIQAGIDAAEDGDTVLVADGIYFGEGNQSISFKGKAITVRSESGPEATIIDARANRGIIFHQNETEATLLSGFTVRNGNADGGAGISLKDSSPVIRNCIITQNIAGGFGGGGIQCDGSSSPIIENCIIRSNVASNTGGGVTCAGTASPTITNCIIDRNTAWRGGGIFCGVKTSPTITNCVITQNKATTTSFPEKGSGIYNGNYSAASILNTIVWENNPIDQQISFDRNGGKITAVLLVLYSDELFHNLLDISAYDGLRKSWQITRAVF